MTAEQDAAAKWQVIEDYKNAKEHLRTLTARVSGWANQFLRIGEILQRSPDDVWENYHADLPTREEFAETAREIQGARAAYERLSDQLRGIGIEPF